MKLSKELTNGLIIFLGIGIYFILMDFLGLSKYYILRIFNVFIVIYGLNRTIKSNLEEGKKGYLQNCISSGVTGFIGIALGIIGLSLYVYYFRGGVTYLNTLSKAFLFGGNPTLAEYCFGLFIEGIASVLIVVFINIQYWNTKEVFKADN
ncbi:hypothetical protein OX283_001450 [Flavobacterium sp. SUN052]|uniref:hypothetical protein n=1 Tax=Flavobacterium sp. SUN052 TaxID=3002441 RepID=UPI00237D96FA|nr:hypothetical protein [Flavobacterium sp. SUN052]MEC4003307.1 hypothetical protein [Flavobacterium sp. SUN052]